MPKRTYQPSSKKKANRKFGFRKRMKKHKKVIKSRRAKGRKKLSK